VILADFLKPDFLKPVQTGNWSGCILKQTMGSVMKSKGKKVLFTVQVIIAITGS